MLVSTKGRYALRIMIDLAEHDTGEFVPLMEIAQRQEISEKYLESIIKLLTRAGFLHSLRGKGGGYKLARKPDQYTIGSILKLTEDGLYTVSCLKNEPNECKRAARCRTLSMWKTLNNLIDDYFEGITISELASPQDTLHQI